jgi:hypothetical protein
MTDAILRQWTLLRMIPREPGTVAVKELHQRLRSSDYAVSLRTVQRDLLGLEQIFPLRQTTATAPRYAGSGRRKPKGWMCPE